MAEGFLEHIFTFSRTHFRVHSQVFRLAFDRINHRYGKPEGRDVCHVRHFGLFRF